MQNHEMCGDHELLEHGQILVGRRCGRHGNSLLQSASRKSLLPKWKGHGFLTASSFQLPASSGSALVFKPSRAILRADPSQTKQSGCRGLAISTQHRAPLVDNLSSRAPLLAKTVGLHDDLSAAPVQSCFSPFSLLSTFFTFTSILTSDLWRTRQVQKGRRKYEREERMNRIFSHQEFYSPRWSSFFPAPSQRTDQSPGLTLP